MPGRRTTAAKARGTGGPAVQSRQIGPTETAPLREDGVSRDDPAAGRPRLPLVARSGSAPTVWQRARRSDVYAAMTPSFAVMARRGRCRSDRGPRARDRVVASAKPTSTGATGSPMSRRPRRAPGLPRRTARSVTGSSVPPLLVFAESGASLSPGGGDAFVAHHSSDGSVRREFSRRDESSTVRCTGDCFGWPSTSAPPCAARC